MAYEGYLIKIKAVPGSQTGDWDYVIPMSKIIYESYKCTYSVLDEDAKRNGTGTLKRTTYPHKVAHCEFTFKQMDNNEFYGIMEFIQLHYVKKRQKKVKARVWVPELNNYVEDSFYLPDIEVTILRQEENKLIYGQTKMELIGY